VQAISGLGLALEACEDAAMVGTGGDVRTKPLYRMLTM